MNKTLVIGGFLAAITLSACGTSQAAGNVQARNGNGAQMMRQNLRQFLTDANAAPDKTELTKEQFAGEIQTLMQAQAATFQRNGSGAMMGRFGSGSMRQGQNGLQDRLATATTFLKYTDSNAQEVLLAVDANGQVVMKWPMAFGHGMRPQTQNNGQ